MKKLCVVAILGGMLLSACESSAVYATETNIAGEGTIGGVRLVMTQQYLSTEGLLGEYLDSGVEYIARATNNNAYRVCASMKFVLPNIESRAMLLEHERGYFLDPGESKNIGYVRFPEDTVVSQFDLLRSRNWAMDAENTYCVPAN